MTSTSLERAWEAVQGGEPRVLRLLGPGGPSEAAAFVAEHRDAFVARWTIDGVPEDDTPRIAWFGEGLASGVAADVVVASVTLLQIPWLVLLTGPDAADRGPPVGQVLEPPAGADPPGASPTDVDHILRAPPNDPDLLLQRLERADRHGRVCEAAAWYRALRQLAPERAALFRSTVVARSRSLVRPDVLEVARSVAGDGPAGRSRLLAAVAAAMERPMSDRLRQASVAAANTPLERADAEFQWDRDRMARGELAPEELRWPAHVPYAAQHLYYLLEKAPWGSDERATLHAQLEALDCDFGRVLLKVADGRVDREDIAYWLDCVRGHLALGQLRNAAFELSGKVLSAPPEQRARLERGVGMIPLSFGDLPALDNAVSAGDWRRARSIAERVAQRGDNPFMEVVADVVALTCRAVLDGDDTGLVGLDREDLREYLQPGFPELLQQAVPAAPPPVRPRLLYQIATWWARLGDEAAHAAACRALAEAECTRIPLGDYVLEERIAAGGMGEVWRGRHARFGEPVAVKLLKPRAEAHLDAFLHEVELTARLDHEAIVQVHDVGRVSPETEAASRGRLRRGRPYLVMEFVPDGTLATLRQPLGPDELGAVLLAILDALAYAHARDVVHRDLKPANVLVHRRPDGLRIRLSDFGLAGMPMAGHVSGTPEYMAPEQFGGSGIGPWSDLYALGCLVTSLLTGAPPFRGHTRELGLRHRFDDPEPLPWLGLPPGFDEWRLRLLAKSPSDRFPHARAAFLALEALTLGSAMPLWAPAAPQAADTFDFQTLVGLAPTSIAVQPEPTPTDPSTLALPESGFTPRTVRPRLPTVHLFGVREVPRIGHRDARERLWKLAREALSTGRVIEAGLSTDAGVPWEPVVSWLVLRLRELGVDARRDEGGALAVLVDTPASRGPAVVLRRGRSAPENLHLARLGQPELVAWVRAQVAVDDELAWEIAQRSHGAPELARAILSDLVRRPGLVAGDGALVLAGALPPVCQAERRFWRDVLGRLAADRGHTVRWAAILVPGFTAAELAEVSGSQVDPTALAGLARSVRGRWTLAGGLRAVVLEELRRKGALPELHRTAAERLEGAGHADPARLGVHLLESGAEQAEEVLMEALLGRLELHHPPDRDLLEALSTALDLRLAHPADPRRGWARLGHGVRQLALGAEHAAERAFLDVIAASTTGWEAATAHARWRLVGIRRTRDVAGALAGWTEPAADDPMAHALRLERALMLRDVGRGAEAWELLAEIARVVPPSSACGVRAATVGAEWAFGDGRCDEALERLAAVRSACASELQAILDLASARMLLASARPAQALEAARQAAIDARGPARIDALGLLARASLEVGAAEDATAAARDGLALLLGTSWPAPRAYLEGVLLAASIGEPTEEWELLWEARGREPSVELAEVLELGAARGHAAGRPVRARWMATEAERVRAAERHAEVTVGVTTSTSRSRRHARG